MCLFFLFVQPAISGGEHRYGSFLLSITFLFNILPGEHVSLVWAGWSVGVEMLFYLVFPLVLIFVQSLGAAFILLAVWTAIGVAAAPVLSEPGFPQWYADFSFLTALSVFGWGIVAYFMFEKLRRRPDARRVGVLVFWLALALAVAAVAAEATLLSVPITKAMMWAPAFGMLVLSQCLVPFGFLCNQVWSHFGKLSFSLYLCHPPIIWYLKPVYDQIYTASPGLGLAYGVAIMVTIAVLYPVAMAAYVLIEQPGMAIGERFAGRFAMQRSRH